MDGVKSYKLAIGNTTTTTSDNVELMRVLYHSRMLRRENKLAAMPPRARLDRGSFAEGRGPDGAFGGTIAGVLGRGGLTRGVRLGGSFGVVSGGVGVGIGIGAKGDVWSWGWRCGIEG